MYNLVNISVQNPMVYVTQFLPAKEIALSDIQGFKEALRISRVDLPSSLENVCYIDSWNFYFHFTHFYIITEATRISKQNS